MSVLGMKNEIKWIKYELNKAKIEVEKLDNKLLSENLQLVEERVKDLEIEYEETVSNIKNL